MTAEMTKAEWEATLAEHDRKRAQRFAEPPANKGGRRMNIYIWVRRSMMGVGAALSEGLTVDLERGCFVNHDLASYEVAVHADIPEQTVIFLDTTDAASSPLKAKGVGELGICGVAAAIANAVYNATGVRVREYPITLDRMIDQLPEAGRGAIL